MTNPLHVSCGRWAESVLILIIYAVGPVLFDEFVEWRKGQS